MRSPGLSLPIGWALAAVLLKRMACLYLELFDVVTVIGSRPSSGSRGLVCLSFSAAPPCWAKKISTWRCKKFRENGYYLALCLSDNNCRAACECFCRRRSGLTRTSAGRWGDMRTCASCSRARTFAQTTFLHSSRSCRRVFRPAGSAFFADFLMHELIN